MRTEPFPIRRCAWKTCNRPFSSRIYRNGEGTTVIQKYCSKGCSNKAFGANGAGDAIKRAAAALKVKRNARLAANLAAKFGDMTERELAIYRFGRERGYDQGYNAKLSIKRVKRIAAETAAHWSQPA